MSQFAADQLAQVKGIVPRPGGKWEAVVSHKSLSTPRLNPFFIREYVQARRAC
jgi:hypothetical protein